MANIDTSGGAGGGNGRLILGDNTSSAFGGSVSGAHQESFSGIRRANPYIKGGANDSPTIPQLESGAEAYGLFKLLDATDETFANIQSAAPSNAVVAVTALSDVYPNFKRPMSGYELLLLINLRGTPLTAPRVGVDPAVPTPVTSMTC